MTELPPDALRSAVRDAYSEIALSEGTSCCEPVPCCTDGSVSLELGYSSDELGAVPAGADLGLGCGNPGAIAALQPGETVLTWAVAQDSTPSWRLGPSVQPAASSGST